jgi:hypothetical protein
LGWVGWVGLGWLGCDTLCLTLVFQNVSQWGTEDVKSWLGWVGLVGSVGLVGDISNFSTGEDHSGDGDQFGVDEAGVSRSGKQDECAGRMGFGSWRSGLLDTGERLGYSGWRYEPRFWSSSRENCIEVWDGTSKVETD